MPKYRMRFERTYEITEGFERIIEAPSLPEAEAAAVNLASSYNMDCPDDCTENASGGAETGDFYVQHVPRSGDTEAADPDIVVLPDGQIVDYDPDPDPDPDPDYDDQGNLRAGSNH